MIANFITGSRIIFSLAMLTFPVFSAGFYFCYMLAGFTDMIDGTIARKLGTESIFGRNFDTLADIVFAPLGLPAEDVERICFIIDHHHTYKAIDGIDFQILVEADYIVNLMEGYCKRESIPEMKKNIFKTETDKYLLEQMFDKSAR